MGLETTQSVIQSLRESVQKEGLTKAPELQDYLRAELINRLDPPPSELFPSNKPAVILLVGVNGSGKTTTAAKLGKRFSNDGKKVLLAAADTFRAAAVDQLQVWAERLDIPLISGQTGGDPGAVAYDAVEAAKARGSDILLIDTAGRLHTRFNLMEELKKVHRVVGKALPGAPHGVWLVLDATTGQNALLQARSFNQTAAVTGVILAKLDSSARGGMAFAIQRELHVPILFAGLGEQPDDLQPFDRNEFVDGILAAR
jgi:fused signal recognition particle receptor